MESLSQFLLDNAADGLLPWRVQVRASERFGWTLGQVERSALDMGLMPARYQRNRKVITVADQRKLFRSRVAVVGCGGLGGYVLEELARLGIGTIVAIDPDVFEEHNLNRQILSSPAVLGDGKVDCARARLEYINPAVTVVGIKAAYAPQNGRELLLGCHVVVDALDSIQTRLALGDTCTEMRIPLVHGAIAGWYGQVITVFPGDDTLRQVYPEGSGNKGAEKQLGNPAFTPAVVASLETAEVCKVLLGAGEPLRHRKLMVNLLDMTFDEIPLEARARVQSATVNAAAAAR